MFWFRAKSLKKMEKQRNLDAQNIKAQLDAIHDVLDTKAKPNLEDFTKGREKEL